MADRIIRITGKGKISVRPDMVRILITQSETFSEYAKAVEELSKKKNLLNEVLGKLGFSREDIKTRRFDVDTVFENYTDKHGNWKKRLKGYRYVHNAKLDFFRNNELFGKVLYALAHCPGNPEFEICFIASDPEKVKNELLGKAIEDARAKAEALTKAAEVSLGEIQTIDYSWGEIQLTTKKLDCIYSVASLHEDVDMYDVDIEPDDIDASETVTVVWEIR